MIGLIASTCAGIFAGVALYISLVEHPVLGEIGDDVPSRFFAPMYRRAAPMQAGLAIAGFAAGVAAWVAGSGALWGLGALLLGAVVPWTLVVIKPVNERLLAADLDPRAPEMPDLLARWGRLHWLRTISSLAAFLCFLTAMRWA